MGSNYFPAPSPPTNIVLPDGSSLNGNVALNEGNNVAIVKSGNGALFVANPPGPRRPLSVFAPGAITARTLQKATIPAAVLQQLDVFLLGAPVGVTGASCGNVQVAGSSSGSLVLPISSALTEWHLGPTDLAIALGAARPQNPGVLNASARGVAQAFTPSSDLTIYNLDVCWTGNTPSKTANGANPTTCRIGIASGLVAGQVPTLDNPGGNGWIKGLDGSSVGWVEIDANNTSVGVRQVLVLPGIQGFKLSQGVTYFLVALHENANPAGSGNMHMDGSSPVNSAALYSGNIAGNNLTLMTNDVSSAGPYAAWTNFGRMEANYSLYGGIVGLALTGLCVVSTTLTGTPATPGSDVEIYAQF